MDITRLDTAKDIDICFQKGEICELTEKKKLFKSGSRRYEEEGKELAGN
jgi:hypothetical protein